MRLFPFLGKVPKYKRFHFEPRYYDAGAEEREQRHARIRHEVLQERAYEEAMEGTLGEDTVAQAGGPTLQRGYLRTARTKTAEPVMDKSSLTRVLLIVIMGGSLYGYLEIGVNALYAGGLAFVGLIYYRLRKG